MRRPEPGEDFEDLLLPSRVESPPARRVPGNGSPDNSLGSYEGSAGDFGLRRIASETLNGYSPARSASTSSPKRPMMQVSRNPLVLMESPPGWTREHSQSCTAWPREIPTAASRTCLSVFASPFFPSLSLSLASFCQFLSANTSACTELRVQPLCRHAPRPPRLLPCREARGAYSALTVCIGVDRARTCLSSLGVLCLQWNLSTLR